MNFGNFDPQMLAGNALDSRALDRLKAGAGVDPKAAIRQTAKEFETLFTQMLLKSMREAVPQSGLMSSNAESTYTSMLDTELSRKISSGNGGKGMGLAEMIVNQLSRQMEPSAAPASPQNANKPPAPNNMPPARDESQAGPRAVGVAAAPASTQQAAATQAAQRHANRARDLAAAKAAITPSHGAGRASKVGDAKQLFVNTMMQHAKVAERATDIKADFMVGQAALESGWGKQEIKHADGRTSHNLFGIKATGEWKGKTASVMTTEYVNGVAKKQVEKFRAYDNYAEAFKDYAKLMKDNPRYKTAVAQGQSAAGFAKSLQRAGYATDPNYASKLTSVINQTVKMSAGMPRL